MVELQQMSVGESHEIKLKGHLAENWADWFDGLTFVHASDGITPLTGRITDQSALHGFLKNIRDLGMPLISVNLLESDPAGLAEELENE